MIKDDAEAGVCKEGKPCEFRIQNADFSWRLRGGRLQLGGQGEKEGRAFFRYGFDPDPATVMLDDFFADGQAHPGAGVLLPGV